MKQRQSLYKDEAPCSELSFLITAEFMKVVAVTGKFWSERELRERVDKVIMKYFKTSGAERSKNSGG